MGVGKTVYKGEVKTGVFAWFSCQKLATATPLWERACSRWRWISNV